MSINMCKKRNSALKEKKNKLVREINGIIQGGSGEEAERLTLLKAQLAELQVRECKAAAIRARARDLVEVES